nr:hypothetical protein [Tanacetum cinerariifolium]
MGSKRMMMMMMMINKLSVDLRLPKLRPVVDAYANVIACLYGMNVIACLHDMVDKLAFMAWSLAYLRDMDEKVSEIGSKARNDEIRNVKFIDT